MPEEIRVTPAGESITHATLVKWLKPDGAKVSAGEPVCELETEKASKEEYAPVTGVLSIQVQPGTRVGRNLRRGGGPIGGDPGPLPCQDSGDERQEESDCRDVCGEPGPVSQPARPPSNAPGR